MQVRPHEAAHFEGIDAGELPLDAKPFARHPQKAHIEACVVRDEGILSLPRPFEELRHRLVEVGRVCNGLIRNAGQLGYGIYNTGYSVSRKERYCRLDELNAACY